LRVRRGGDQHRRCEGDTPVSHEITPWWDQIRFRAAIDVIEEPGGI
jgi:hypothetical protein